MKLLAAYKTKHKGNIFGRDAKFWTYYLCVAF